MLIEQHDLIEQHGPEGHKLAAVQAFDGLCQLICIDAIRGRARGGFPSFFLQAAKGGVVICCQIWNRVRSSCR